ncbi:MAG: hypothetical protein Q8922_10380 [Bacteroidota bacterium]|nr:hypothetical protein [Bacteroidota bacterium]MDP4234592.1 hypothetical protein [Bacteroidota bacterium]MDP4243721.1 hypothetical protein [Bacteroidota bacterium]MDP4288331.1 hypothetical protein [Bacteroidota bacterium]
MNNQLAIRRCEWFFRFEYLSSSAQSMPSQEHQVVFSFAASVPPGKDAMREVAHVPQIRYSQPQMGTTAQTYFKELFNKSAEECKVEIQFRSGGSQDNLVRDTLVAICGTEDIDEKRRLATGLAHRLYSVTDHRNKTGLFTIIEGKRGNKHRVLLTRFREDEVITTNPRNDGTIDLEVIMEAFTKKSQFYKSALFEDEHSRSMFWNGRIVDKQITKTHNDVSRYWMSDFLNAQSSLTSRQGTTNLARYIKTAIEKEESVNGKQALIAASVLLNQRAGENFSVRQFCETYLSDDIARRFRSVVKSELEFESMFEINAEVLDSEIGSTLLSLANGIQLSVPTFLYSNSVHEVRMDDGGTEVTVTGKVVNKKLRKKTK